MGGYGSGRTGGTCTAEGTASYVLTAKMLKSLPHLTSCTAEGTWRWSDGFTLSYLIDARNPNFPILRLTHETRDGAEESTTYEVRLTSMPTSFNGRRWWFECPSVRSRIFKLYLPNGGRRFLSRRAYRLGYACQRETRVDRLMRKARKLHRALGGHGEEIGDGWVPPKPKGMRWRTYEKKVEKWQAADAAAENAWALGALRFFRF